MTDVIVIGGGVMGLTSAYELAGRGATVTVLDRQEPGREASWAGAGILPPGEEGDPEHPIAKLCAATHPLWPELSETLREQTGIDNGFRQCGGICFSPDGDVASLQMEIDAWRKAGVRIAPLTPPELRTLEPKIGPAAGPAYHLPDTWQVRNPRHLKALLAGCAQRGVSIRSGQPVTHIECRGDRITAVHTPTEMLQADAYLVTAGPWSQQLLERSSRPRKVEPVRGQIVLLSTSSPVVRHIIECGPRYLVPRPDGRTLVGSTEEWVGFDKQNTPAAIRGLMDFAIKLVPSLAEAKFEQSWSGLRPHAVDGLPLIGRMPGCDNLYVATGHFRSGLHLSPITGRLIAQLITGEPTDLSLDDFNPGR